MTARIAQVLLDSPLPQLDHLFDYAVPDHLVGAVTMGCRVRVPLRMGNRVVDAFVVRLVETSDFSGSLHEIESVVTSVAVLPPQLYDLARRVADRQAGSASDVLRLAIPPRYVRVEKAFGSEEARNARRDARARLTETLSNRAELIESAHPFSNIEPGSCRSVIMPTGTSSLPSGDVPAWSISVAQAAADALRGGESSLIVVPSYRDSDDFIRALTSLGVGDALVRTDARQSGGERYAAYLRILEREPVIVVGNRSATYAPAHNIGLIVMWDDGDSLFSEPLAPYAHARDVALVASQLAGSRIVFAGNVASVEAQRLVSLGFASEWSASRKSYPQVVPTDSLVNEGSRARIPSVAWAHAREQSALGPVLLQVARAGYAPALCCKECRVRAVCSTCSGPLSMPSARSTPTCAWCGAMAAQWRCPDCASTAFRLISSGSERTAEELGRAFPNTRVIVADGAHRVQNVLDEPCLVIATPGAEPLAQNGYRCVVVLDGESYRSRAGLRVDEDAVRHWCNALALARHDATCFLVGAGPQLGRVIATWDLRGFAKRELQQRAALGLPPVRRAATVTGPFADVDSACNNVRSLGRTRVMGPTSAQGDARAIVLFDYRDGDAVTSALRASIVTTATKSGRRKSGDSRTERVVRLRVRVDDAELGDSL